MKLLVEACETVVVMDDSGTEVNGGSILVADGVIEWVGTGPPPSPADQVFDGRGTVALPGLVNAHHHLYQSMTRVRASRSDLFEWLTELYPVWARLDEEWERAASRVGLAELALSGCTTTTDHHYVFPTGAEGLMEAEIEAAAEIGVRFHPCRGSMDLGRRDGGLPPDSVVQDVDTILTHTEEMVDRFHDPSPGSMLRLAVAPCSPFSVTERLMKESAELARRRGVRLHTHVAETHDEEAFCRERYGRRPVELLDDLGWLGDDVWLAHCIHLDDRDIDRIADTRTGVASCPTSNLRLGAGIAPVRRLMEAGAVVGLGVDGSASNDAAHLLGEAKQAMLVARAGGDAAAIDARDALRLATRGGASCLGREDVSSLEPGKRADLAMFGVDGLSFAGAEADLVAAVVYTAPHRVRHLLVEGRFVVRDGVLSNADEAAIAAEGRRVGRRIADRAEAMAP
jgi:cytosine/adenosine deaminase-related metal-dependent hydrolase